MRIQLVKLVVEKFIPKKEVCFYVLFNEGGYNIGFASASEVDGLYPITFNKGSALKVLEDNFGKKPEKEGLIGIAKTAEEANKRIFDHLTVVAKKLADEVEIEFVDGYKAD